MPEPRSGIKGLGLAAFIAASLALGGAWFFWGSGMTETTQEALTGTWLKASTEDCAAPYPAQLVLKPGGIYEAPGGPDAGSVWHSGDWELRDGALVIQMANDEMRPYRLSINEAGQLIFEDDVGCVIAYARQA